MGGPEKKGRWRESIKERMTRKVGKVWFIKERGDREREQEENLIKVTR